jgi:hypothetical protein
MPVRQRSSKNDGVGRIAADYFVRPSTMIMAMMATLVAAVVVLFRACTLDIVYQERTLNWIDVQIYVSRIFKNRLLSSIYEHKKRETPCATTHRQNGLIKTRQ